MAVAMQEEDFPYLPSGPAEVNKMIKDYGDLFSDAQCKVCSAVLISESQKLTHYQSKKHANKVRRYFNIQNDVKPILKKIKSPSPDSANVQTNTLRPKPVGPQMPASPAVLPTPPAVQPKIKPAEDSSDGGTGNDNPDRFCSICQASFNNPLMAQQHYMGKKHRKHMTKRKLMETYGLSTAPASTQRGYSCSVCNIELNSVEQYQSHISGAKHKNRMKRSGAGAAESQQEAGQTNVMDDHDQLSEPLATTKAPYTAENKQFAAEDAEFSEEYRFT